MRWPSGVTTTLFALVGKGAVAITELLAVLTSVIPPAVAHVDNRRIKGGASSKLRRGPQGASSANQQDQKYEGGESHCPRNVPVDIGNAHGDSRFLTGRADWHCAVVSIEES